jgi:hypothetical protein
MAAVVTPPYSSPQKAARDRPSWNDDRPQMPNFRPGFGRVAYEVEVLFLRSHCGSQAKINKAAKRNNDHLTASLVGRALGCPVTSPYRTKIGAQRNSRIKLNTGVAG